MRGFLLSARPTGNVEKSLQPRESRYLAMANTWQKALDFRLGRQRDDRMLRVGRAHDHNATAKRAARQQSAPDRKLLEAPTRTLMTVRGGEKLAINPRQLAAAPSAASASATADSQREVTK